MLFTFRIRFHVVFASSEEADYPASELNIHGPSTKGWQSVKFAKYPQEIGIEIDSKGLGTLFSIRLFLV